MNKEENVNFTLAPFSLSKKKKKKKKKQQQQLYAFTCIN